MKDYAKQHKDPRWQKLRLKLFEAAGWRCQSCGSESQTLQAHHINYEKGADYWDYPHENFKVLCEGCHEQLTQSIRNVRELLSSLISEDAEYLVNTLISAHNYHQFTSKHRVSGGGLIRISESMRKISAVMDGAEVNRELYERWMSVELNS